MENETEKKSYGYGKRPMWQWIVIYLVLAVIVYGAIYYFFLSKKGGYGNSTPIQTPSSKTQSQSNSAPLSNIYMMKTDPTKGSYLTDFQGMTLYISDQDKKGVSNCTGSCAQTWRPYTSGATAQTQFPANISLITRSDGSKQFAYKGMPLYYFSGDTQSGQTSGDGVNGFHLAK